MQSARNSGLSPTPAGTGSALSARNAFTCAPHTAGSTGIHPPLATTAAGALTAGGAVEAVAFVVAARDATADGEAAAAAAAGPGETALGLGDAG